jgi:hypothetical protein
MSEPGVTLGSGYLFYTGSAGSAVTPPFGGVLASKVSADVSLADIDLGYTFRPTILGAHYTASVAIPYAWVDVEAKISINPRLRTSLITPRTKTVNDGDNGLSDIFLIPFALNWTSDRNKWLPLKAFLRKPPGKAK